MVSVNIDEKYWIPFLKQSIDLKVSASERIRNFIVGELKNDKNFRGDIND